MGFAGRQTIDFAHPRKGALGRRVLAISAPGLRAES